MKFARASVAAFLGIILSANVAHAEKVASMPAPTGYVDDYANVLTAPAKTQLEDLCKELHAKTKAQVFFVTVNTLDGEAMEPFANELFHKWKIGEKKTDRGILVILSIAEHQRRIEVGYGLEGILNDAKVGDIGREMVPALKASNYDEAARIGVSDVSKVIATDAGVTLDALEQTPPTTPETQPVEVEQTDGQSLPWFIGLAPFLLAFGVFGLVIWNQFRRGTRFGTGTGISAGSSGFINSDSSSSSFSSSDSSSSSDSFSGGDGGDSGGGGAGGSW